MRPLDTVTINAIADLTTRLSQFPPEVLTVLREEVQNLLTAIDAAVAPAAAPIVVRSAQVPPTVPAPA
jgi:hypothetical protein